jgi:hypothetical protein
VRRGAVLKRAEAAQQRELLFPEAGDVGEALGAGQVREKGQQQHLVERVDHLGPLPRIGQVLEMVEEDRCLEDVAAVACRIVHRRPLSCESRTPMDSTLPSFVTY